MNFETISMLVAGIALFLFGMMFFEQTISTAFGSNVKDFIYKYTSSLLKSIGVGMTSTGILQSSTVVIMLMLWFVGANILNLQQGIGIVLGANIGTTMTPWIVALLWFKFKIEVITLPIIALWGILMIAWWNNKKLVNISKFLFGFGLLFLWLAYMKESVDALAGVFSLDDANMGLLRSILLWAIVTIILQTSTWTSVMTLTALSSGMITFDIALGMIIGANIWSAFTTFVVWFLSNTGKYKTKRVIASTHMILNIYQLIVMLILFKPVYRLLHATGIAHDPVVGIAMYHTLYNIIGVGLFIPWVPLYTKFIYKKKFLEQEDQTLFHIEQVSTTMPEEYIVAMNQDIVDFGEEIVDLIQSMANHTEPTDVVLSKYTHIKNDCEEWMTKVLQYDITQCDPNQQQQIEQYQLSVVNFLSAIKQLKDISGHYYYLRESSSTGIHKYMDQFDEKLQHLADIVQYVIHHKSDVAMNKIAEWEKVLILDDTRFLKDIKNSITTHNHDTENNHYRSQLLKTNRSVVVATKSLLEWLIDFHEKQD